MPEREYFSLRYAIPGYTLILIVIGINHVPLIKTLAQFQTTFGAFLAFLSLLTGSALGFLVSQLWWWYRKKGGLYGIEEFKEVLEALIDEFDLPDRYKNPQENDDKLKVIAFYDYVSHSEEKEREKLFSYSERRWDMYHLLSSTLWALKIGLVVGIFWRFFSEFFLLKPLFSTFFLDLISGPFIENAERWGLLVTELMVLISIFVSAGLLICILPKAVRWTIFEYAAVAKARIRSTKVCARNEIKKAFSDVFTHAQEET